MTERRAPRPSGKKFDEIRIKTVPYYRVGSLQQSEWRTRKVVEVANKGAVLDLNLDPDTQWVLVEVVSRLLSDEKRRETDATTETEQCDQEGCQAQSTVTYRMKHLYNGRDIPIDPYVVDERPLVRKFCDEHKKRGEGYYEDSDDNYELIQ